MNKIDFKNCVFGKRIIKKDNKDLIYFFNEPYLTDDVNRVHYVRYLKVDDFGNLLHCTVSRFVFLKKFDVVWD